MNGKNIELSNINSQNNKSNANFSFSQNQPQENNRIVSELESTLFNGTIMTVDINNNINHRANRFTNIENNKKNKSKLEKSKNTLSSANLRKKIYICFFSFINHLNILSERTISFQVGIVYAFLMIILSLGIAYIKAYHIMDIIDSLTNKNYFTFYVNNIIDSQREIKILLDELNNHDITSVSNDPLLFNRILTEELVENKILNKDTIILQQNIEKTYSDLGSNYELSNDLYKLADIYNSSSFEVNNNLDYNIKNMMPFYYHYSPIIISHLNNCGIQINNFYFIARGELECTNKVDEKDTINTMYFKYPLEDLNLGPNSNQKNNKIYDFILDPYSSCNDDYYGQDYIINNIKIYNWFSRCLRDPTVNFRIFKIKKITEEKKKKDYLIFFSKTQNLPYDDSNKIFFTFSIKISQDNYPFIKLDERDDILNFDYLSIYNFKNKFLSTEEERNVKKLFEIDYDIDDSQNVLFKTPKFLSNIHLYSMEELKHENIFNENSNYKNGEHVLLKYNEMIDMNEYYDINYYFLKDSLIFKLIYFLNQFFSFKKNHPEYLTPNYDDLRNDIETETDHPCIISGSQEYYELIKKEFNYDCQNDYCFYNDCDQAYNNFQDPKNLLFLPNCYCIPLFCRDTQSPISEFHKLIKDKIKKINKSFSDNAYSFTSSYNDYILKKNYKFSKTDEYFDRNNFVFNCKMSLNQKNNTYNNFFKTKIKIQNLAYQCGDNAFLMFFMNNNMTSFLIHNFLKLNTTFLLYVFFIYLFLVLCSLVLLIRYIVSQVNNLTDRIEKVKKIRKAIITNQIDNNNYEDNNSNSNLEILSNINDDNKSDNSNGSNNNNKKDKKDSQNNNKTIIELDELDTLTNLINENVSEFQIKFNLTEDMNSNINDIKNQYNGIIKVNQYKNKLLMKNYNINNNSFDEDEPSNTSNSEEKNENFDDLSLKMFYELLSTSTSEIDFSNIKNNFYYKNNEEKMIFGLEEILALFIDEDNNRNGEITNINKIQNAINYYYVNIHNYWKREYDNLKKEENI